MEEYRNHNEPWDPSIYGTGRTKPPKNHGGIIAILLVIIIFLGGLVSVLGILNVKLFTQLKNQSNKNDHSLAVVSQSEAQLLETSPAPEQTVPASQSEDHEHLSLNPTPDSVPNMTQEGGLSLQQIYADNIDSVVSIFCSVPALRA